MATTVGTHSGGFHADDVLAFALVQVFHDPDATVVRSRDLDVLAKCDIVVDVGGLFDPGTQRFDHHQVDYQGPLSSAGMVLAWLAKEGKVGKRLAAQLRYELVDYVDAVDNGRRTPERSTPCFPSVVGSFNNNADESTFDDWYLRAAAVARDYVSGICKGFAAVDAARATVAKAMTEAVADGRRVLYLDQYVPWKAGYFENGGVDHPTDFVLLPSEGRWRILAIPPELGSFANKVPLPESWAGLTDADLEKVCGVKGARFCHKNRFIAVFETREGAVEALEKWDLMHGA